MEKHKQIFLKISASYENVSNFLSKTICIISVQAIDQEILAFKVGDITFLIKHNIERAAALL
uniref:Uncharacterized protein n=1 Tax=Romanomermis culicivorax TaxID=13658 RepID=A0A915IM86_ROMCU